MKSTARFGRYVIIGALLIAAYVGYMYFNAAKVSFNEVRRDGIVLMGSMRSYSSTEEFKRRMTAQGLVCVVKVAGYPYLNKGVPSLIFTTVKTSGFIYLDELGRLEADFVNDRLYQLRFIPSNAAAFLIKARSVGAAQSEGFRGPGGDLTTKFYPETGELWWADERLLEEIRLWQSRYQ